MAAEIEHRNKLRELKVKKLEEKLKKAQEEIVALKSGKSRCHVRFNA